MKYAVIIEKAKKNYSVYVPDLPGCVATGRTPAEAKRRIAQAIAFHVEGLRDAGQRVPRPSSKAEYVEAVEDR